MSLPRTLGELQLYLLLQRANLSVYYQTFVQQGGDDVRQLCEAGEEEFLEIMTLVGMAAKPLHVRRLQKALREWVANPATFNQPLASELARFKLSDASPQEPKRKSVSGSSDTFPESKRLRSLTTTSAGSTSPNSSSDGEGKCPPESEEERANQGSGVQLVAPLPTSGPEEAAERLRLNKKLANSGMEDSDPAKEEEIWKLCGRSDSKRRDSKQLTQQQLVINEVAAQFCKEDSSLLLRRVDLFSLVRSVARECAYRKIRLNSEEIDEPSVKNSKLENQLGVNSEQTIVVESEEEFIKHQDIDSMVSSYNTKEDNGSLFGNVIPGQPHSAGCRWRPCSSACTWADAAKIASTQGSGNRHLPQQTLRDQRLRVAELVSDKQRSGLQPRRREIAQSGESLESRSASKNTENGLRAVKKEDV